MATSDADILSAEGFAPVGRLDWNVELEVWWHPAAKVELITVRLGAGLLLKGTKAYYLTSIAAEAETWARDIGPMHDYLESHFRDLHIAFSFFRDVPMFLADRAARRTVRASSETAPPHSPRAVREVARRAEASLRSIERLAQLDEGGSALLTQHLRGLAARRRSELQQAQDAKSDADEQAAALQHLQHEYRRKGSAACLTFSLGSNVQIAATDQELVDAVRSIVKELTDANRYQVRQMLTGSRLQIQVAESEEPVLAWIEQWLGGALNPSQLERLCRDRPAATEALTHQTMVTPDEDIAVNGTVVDHRKLLAPRVVSSMLGRLDHTEDLLSAKTTSTRPGPTITLGLRVSGEQVSDSPFAPVLVQGDHAYISGATGSGKSVALRVIAEEVAAHESIAVVVVDPRNQCAGLLVPEDRPDLIERYAGFGLGGPTGFQFVYHAPANPAAPPLPADLSALTTPGGRHAVSLKRMDDKERCTRFAEIMDAVFEACSTSEVAAVRLVVLVEEAQLFTKRLVSEGAKAAAAKAEASLDRLLREGRKFGITVVVSSQSMRDFARDAAAIRQNANTKIFLHNSDREIEYARDYLEDPRALVRLPAGQGYACNPAWGSVRLAFRPPRSKVWDFSEAETAQIIGGRRQTTAPLSAEARHLLDAIRALIARGGTAPNMTQVARTAGVTSKRRLQQLVDELAKAGMVRTRRLPEQGQPRVVEVLPEDVLSMDGTNGRPAADATGQEVRGDAPTNA